MSQLPRFADNNVLVGFDTADDAGVYKLTPELALVQTVDFFTPIVDDPYTFGAIAAANALSDVYAMGGTPLSALSILAWPANGELDSLSEILKGGAAKLREAGCALLGGHSIADDEIKFGYAVTGTVHPERVLTNAGAMPGDALVFTKEIGTGVIATALKRGIAGDAEVEGAIQSMLRLNREAAEAMRDLEVHACTDVTGFGLIGHAREMAIASRVTLEIHTAAVRFLQGAEEYARQGAVSGGLNNNREFASPCVEIAGGFDPAIEQLLYDPQTSGGLLVSLPERDAMLLVRKLGGAYNIGRVLPKLAKPIRLT